LRNKVEHHLLQNFRAVWQLFAVDQHSKTLSPEMFFWRYRITARIQCLCGFGDASLVSLPALCLAQIDTRKERA
jgi:hypothetical protein